MITSPEQESLIIRRAALRGGCVVRSLSFRPTQFGVRAIGQVDCPDGWGAARMLLAASIEDAKNPHVKQIAQALRRAAPSDDDFARAVHAFVKRNVRFVRERGEIFQGTMFSLASGAGDCDDHARPVFAIATAGELPARMAFLHHGGEDAQPTHVVTQLGPNGVWDWAETTIDAHYGEHPLDAAERWHLVGERDDLAEEVRVMTEQDLAPIPANYLRANPPDKIDRDVEALARVGFPIESICGHQFEANDPRFRSVVAAFQRSHPPLTVDGLIGPKTRRAIGELLIRDDFGIGYLGSMAGISGPSDHVNAAPVIREAWNKVHGRDPTEEEAVITQAIASLETGYGRWAGQHAENAARGDFNWGNIEKSRASDSAPCPQTARADGGRWIPGFDSVSGLEEEAKRVPVCFLVFDTDIDAAAAYIRTLTKSHWPTVDAMKIGPEAVAHAMKVAPAYYTASEEKYGAGIRARADAIRKALSLTPQPSGGGSAPTLLAVTIGVGLIGTLAAAWVAARS